MRFIVTTIMALGLLALVSTAAQADDLVAGSGASSRDVQTAVDSYMATGSDDVSLVGGTGSAGYDSGFWIRGGDFLLRINATLQARYEAWDWDDEDLAGRRFENRPFGEWAGDTSGFSLPRATLKFSGEAPCSIRYYLELEFGHFGRDVVEERDSIWGGRSEDVGTASGFFSQTRNYDNTREAWIEWGSSAVFNVRMGQVQLASTRQMMTAPELQQFVDVSYANAMSGWMMPGYTDRNRDHGFLIHGGFGCSNEWSYMLSVTNGDGGDSIRNVIDHRTSDNLAFGGRVNWAFMAPIGYEEGALRQQTCQWYGELGAWGFYYADRLDKPHESVGDMTVWGLDLAMGYGGWSFTAAYSAYSSADADLSADIDGTSWLAQLGYHFPGTAWEVAARASSSFEDDSFGDGTMTEYAFGVNYYLNGHANKLQLDATFLEASDDISGLLDPYPGFQGGFGNENSAVLIRFQWQLAL
jgi:hypothetical protein